MPKYLYDKNVNWIRCRFRIISHEPVISHINNSFCISFKIFKYETLQKYCIQKFTYVPRFNNTLKQYIKRSLLFWTLYPKIQYIFLEKLLSLEIILHFRIDKGK